MSAYQVAPATIDLIVSYLIEAGVVPLDEAEGTALTLWQENARSIAYRYHNGDFQEAMREAGPYTFTHYIQVQGDGAYGCANCFDYQASEHPEWEASKACALVGLVKNYTGRAKASAPWGVESDVDALRYARLAPKLFLVKG